ncbi:MAG TPA: hypothetical protein VFV49_01675, partial [Thermoanaerobaculia bacterium]|nr:hypothetical protein [Thermoanaerobaculia bacterium]
YQKARAIDPLSPRMMTGYGFLLGLMRQYDRALMVLRESVEQFPEYVNTWSFIGLTSSWAGRHDEAIAVQSRMMPTETNPTVLVLKGIILARAGRIAEARAIAGQADEMAQVRFMQPYYRAQLHAALGDRELALTLLEQTVRDGEWFAAWLPHDPGVDVLRSDPRFAALLQRSVARH